MVIALLLGTAGARAVQLQGIDSQAYAAEAAKKMQYTKELPASRGTISDRSGVVLADTDPATRADRIIVADTDDGEPLSPEAGPFMIVAEGDVRAARSARMVVSIRVIPLGEPQN